MGLLSAAIVHGGEELAFTQVKKRCSPVRHVRRHEDSTSDTSNTEIQEMRCENSIILLVTVDSMHVERLETAVRSS